MDQVLEWQSLARIDELFGPGSSADCERNMPALLALGREIGAEAGDALIDRHPRLSDLAPAASRQYFEYIWKHERAESAALLAQEQLPDFRYSGLAGKFGRHNYDRVRDMFVVVDFNAARCFTMVGCGPVPMTLYHVHDKTSVADLVALDTDSEAIDTVASTARHFDLSRITAHASAGEAFDYSGTEVIYVANLVRPKQLVLRRIADTAPRGAVIVLRDPYSLGRLLTERGTDDLDARLTITGRSDPEFGHFSRHVFLRLDRS
jgi:hypothetical protein